MARFWPLVLPLVVATALRLAIVLTFPDMPLHGDERDYFTGAQQLVAGETVEPVPYRPPLYIGFLALVIASFGPATDPVRFVQIGLELLTMVGLFCLGRRAFSRRAGLVAVWLYALYPDFVAYSHYLWSETLSLCLLSLGLLALVRLNEQPDARRAVVAGLAFGLLNLAKPYHTFIFPLLLVVVVAAAPPGARGAAARQAALALGVLLVVALPYSVFASRRAERPVLISTQGMKNVKDGLSTIPPWQTDLGSEWYGTRKLRRRSGHDRALDGLPFVVDHPGLFVQRAFQKLSYLWAPNAFHVRYLYLAFPPDRMSKYGSPTLADLPRRRRLAHGSMAATMLLSAAFVLGLFLARGRLLVGLASVYVASYCSMITLTNSLSRYRLPLMLFATLFAGALLSAQVDWGQLRASRLRAALLTICGAALVAFWIMRVPGIVAAIP